MQLITGALIITNIPPAVRFDKTTQTKTNAIIIETNEMDMIQAIHTVINSTQSYRKASAHLLSRRTANKGVVIRQTPSSYIR